MGKILSREEVLKRFNFIHNFKYDYSKVIYKGTSYSVEIICKKHGVFKQLVHSHLKGYGCPKCSKNEKYTTETFVIKAKEVHGSNYDYSRTKYQGANNKVIIGCKKHGDFLQTAAQHIFGAKCIKCLRENPTGWGRKSWFNAAGKSKHFESYKVYLVKLKVKGREYYKIGRTYNTLKERFRKYGKRVEVLNFIILEEILEVDDFEGLCRVYDLENKLKKQNSKYLDVPDVNFKGKYECFNNIIL